MVDPEPLDFEDIAIQQLAKRAGQIHVRVGLASAVIGVCAGLLTAWVGLGIAGMLPGVVYGALFFGPLLGAVYLGRGYARARIDRQAPAWSKEMAERYQLNPAQLREYIEHM